jgi:type II secretory pathway pseudopilin PulG
MLTVLLILACALVPVVADSVRTARLVRARQDLSQIARALVDFQRDVGPMVLGDASQPAARRGSDVQVVEVLVTAGGIPGIDSRDPDAALRPWIDRSAMDVMDSQLRLNRHGYQLSQQGPGSGWNGPYLERAITGDPWGHRYLVNIGFLRENPSRQDRCASCAVFVLSAGPDGLLQTPFEQPIADASLVGDDLGVRIQ